MATSCAVERVRQIIHQDSGGGYWCFLHGNKRRGHVLDLYAATKTLVGSTSTSPGEFEDANFSFRQIELAYLCHDGCHRKTMAEASGRNRTRS